MKILVQLTSGAVCHGLVESIDLIKQVLVIQGMGAVSIILLQDDLWSEISRV